MIIWVPLAVFSALDPDPLNCNAIIRTYADQYVTAGIIYIVNTY